MCIDSGQIYFIVNIFLSTSATYNPATVNTLIHEDDKSMKFCIISSIYTALSFQPQI